MPVLSRSCWLRAAHWFGELTGAPAQQGSMHAVVPAPLAAAAAGSSGSRVHLRSAVPASVARDVSPTACLVCNRLLVLFSSVSAPCPLCVQAAGPSNSPAGLGAAGAPQVPPSLPPGSQDVAAGAAARHGHSSASCRWQRRPSATAGVGPAGAAARPQPCDPAAHRAPAANCWACCLPPHRLVVTCLRTNGCTSVKLQLVSSSANHDMLALSWQVLTGRYIGKGVWSGHAQQHVLGQKQGCAKYREAPSKRACWRACLLG